MNFKIVIDILRQRSAIAQTNGKRIQATKTSVDPDAVAMQSEYRLLANLADAFEAGLERSDRAREPRFHPAVLKAHEQFGGDLEEMQYNYDNSFPVAREDNTPLQENDTATVKGRVFIWVNETWIPFTGERKVVVTNVGEVNMRVIKDDVPEEEVKNGDIRVLGDDVYVRVNGAWQYVGAIVRD